MPDAIALAKAVAITEQFTASCAVEELKGLASAAGGQQTANDRGAQRSGPAPKCFVNSLTVRAPQQVLLEVRFVEAQRTAARDLGLSWDTQSKRFRGVTGAVVSPILDGPNVPGPLCSRACLRAQSLSAHLSRAYWIMAQRPMWLSRRWRRKGSRGGWPSRTSWRCQVTPPIFSLAASFRFRSRSPQRRAATYHAGIQEVWRGSRLHADGAADGQINLKIEPEVSDIDHTNSFSLGSGITVPASWCGAPTRR